MQSIQGSTDSEERTERDSSHPRLSERIFSGVILGLPTGLAVSLCLTMGHFHFPTAMAGLMGLVMGNLLLCCLDSGVTSSNWGRYERETSPLRYWADIAALVLFYLFILFCNIAFSLQENLI